MKFDQLASSTPSGIISRASQVQVHPEGKEHIESIDQHAFTFQTWTGGKAYVSWVCVDENEDVHVSCSCAYFLYNLEVALASAGASVIFFSNGAHPVKRNPSMQRHLCKHLYRLWQFRGVYNIKYEPPEEEEFVEPEELPVEEPEVIEEPAPEPEEEAPPEEQPEPEEEEPAAEEEPAEPEATPGEPDEEEELL